MGPVGALLLVLAGLAFALGARTLAGRLAVVGLALAVLGPLALALGAAVLNEIPGEVMVLLVVLALVVVLGALPTSTRREPRTTRPTSGKTRVERD